MPPPEMQSAVRPDTRASRRWPLEAVAARTRRSARAPVDRPSSRAAPGTRPPAPRRGRATLWDRRSRSRSSAGFSAGVSIVMQAPCTNGATVPPRLSAQRRNVRPAEWTRCLPDWTTRRRQRSVPAGMSRIAASRTRDHAEPAGLTARGARRVRRLHAMHEHLRAREPGERLEVGVVDAADLEDVVRADVDAVTLCPRSGRGRSTGCQAPGAALHCSPGRSGWAAAFRAFSLSRLTVLSQGAASLCSPKVGFTVPPKVRLHRTTTEYSRPCPSRRSSTRSRWPGRGRTRRKGRAPSGT